MRNKRKKLMEDFILMWVKSVKENYLLTPKDMFAIGYLCGKYDVEKLLNNEYVILDVCREYDKTDDLALLDTIGEIFIDLKIISNKKKIL